MNVFIRTDASLQIGTGHVMRCLTLADELSKNGATVYFVCREFTGNIISQIQEKGYTVFSLAVVDANQHINEELELQSHKSWLGVSIEKDAQDTLNIISNYSHVDWLVVDHYAIDATWESAISKVVNNILVIDDLANREHCCNILLDQNVYENRGYRYKDLLPEKCLQLLGPEYTLLRKEFYEIRQKMNQRDGRLQKIFIFFGGVDLTNMTGKVLEAIIKMNIHSHYIIDVVIGASNPHRQSIELVCSEKKEIFLHVQVANMASMMAESDLCIGSGGTITWERCCLGLPAIAWAVAENQKQLLIDCSKAGLLYAPDSENPTLDDIAIHITALTQNSGLRKHMSMLGQLAIDGKGAVRVASRMLKSNIELQPVVLTDMQKIYEWRNHISTRQYSRNTEEIDFEQHCKWFNEMLSDDNKLVFIGISDGEEIGVLRFDIAKSQAEISIYLVPGKQGHGYGSALVVAAEEWLAKYRTKIKNIIADVLPENTASNKLFENNGYKLNKVQYKKSII